MRKLEHNDFPEKEKELNLSQKEVGKVPFKRNQKIARGFLHVFYDGKLLKKKEQLHVSIFIKFAKYTR